jgi:hypothetical protein
MAVALEICGWECISSTSFAPAWPALAALLTSLSSHALTRPSALRKASWKELDFGSDSLKKARPN